jgi:hypothetical protein
MGIGGTLKLEEGTGNGTYIGFKAPDTEVTSDLIWSLPQGNQTNWHYLQCCSNSADINPHQFGSTILSSY